MDATSMEPTTATIGGWALSKGALSAGGLLGALGVASMYIPKKLQERFPRTSGAIAGGLGVVMALSAGSMLILSMGWDASSPDVNFSVGVLSGLCAAAILVWIANTLKKTEENDVFEVVKMAKKQEIPAKKPVRRVRAGTAKK